MSYSEETATDFLCVTSYRFVRLVDGNYEIASKENADCIGEYVTGSDGLPTHLRDWPTACAASFIFIESA